MVLQVHHIAAYLYSNLTPGHISSDITMLTQLRLSSLKKTEKRDCGQWEMCKNKLTVHVLLYKQLFVCVCMIAMDI